MSNLYFVIGASGSGKTAIIPELKRHLRYQFNVYDFDEIGMPEGADKKWRQESTEAWLQKLLKEDRDSCLHGQMVLGEILACPSSSKLDKVNICLLDVNDFERIQRLRKSNTHGSVDQHMLNWSAWLRMHHQDPQWMQQVVKEDCWNQLNFSNWENLDNWTEKANIQFIETTKLSIKEVAAKVAQWITV